MPETIPEGSVGVVSPHTFEFSQSLELSGGKTLHGFTLVYECYGELNADKSNALLVCHALSGDHHAAGYHSLSDKKPGWWDNAIGPGKPFDTNKFFIVCVNNLGGCSGSTGPLSINPETGKSWGASFPLITVDDWVAAQAMLSDSLGIEQWAAVIGGSLGGMQVMQWAIQYPDRLRHAIVIASAAKLSAQNIAFNEVARQAIRSDPDYFDGYYMEHDTVPAQGLKLARMLGHITYLSAESMRMKFGRELRQEQINFSYDVDFQVESYLRYQGQSFVDRFDANSYLLMTKALDYFDPSTKHDGDLVKTFEGINARFLICSFTSDWRFAPSRSREIVKALLDNGKRVSYAEIEADQGHDSFLLPIPIYMQTLANYMSKIVATEI